MIMKPLSFFVGLVLLVGTSLLVSAQDGNPDDHGSSPESATAIAQDSTTAGVITPAGDLDYFLLNVETTGTLTIRTTGATDTVGILFDASGVGVLSENDDWEDTEDEDDYNFRITWPVAPGTYYLEVSGYDEEESGPYQLVSSLLPGAPPEDEHGDNPGNATAIALDSATDGFINLAGDLDYFLLTVETAGTLTIRTIGSTDTVGTLLDASGNLLAENDDWEDTEDEDDYNFRITWNAIPGTYYLEVSGYDGQESGPYQLISSLQPDGLPDDDHGNSTDNATAIATGSTTNGVIDPAGDLDYFRIVVDTAGTLSIRTTGSTDTVGTLFASTGTVLITDTEINEVDLNFAISYPLTPGTYYLEVSGYDEQESGPYQLISSLQPVSPPRLVNVVVDEVFLEDTGMRNWRFSLLAEGLIPGQVYHVQESIDGETFSKTGIGFTANAPEARIPWSWSEMDEAARLLFKIGAGPAAVFEDGE